MEGMRERNKVGLITIVSTCATKDEVKHDSEAIAAYLSSVYQLPRSPPSLTLPLSSLIARRSSGLTSSQRSRDCFEDNPGVDELLQWHLLKLIFMNCRRCNSYLVLFESSDHRSGKWSGFSATTTSLTCLNRFEETVPRTQKAFITSKNV